jgi:putative transposase
MKKFNNKYRIPTARLPNYDYSMNGNYFITICTLGRMQHFGKIKNEEMILNEMGMIIEDLILGMVKQFQEIRIVEHIIMPDHVHFIINISKPKDDISAETRLTETGLPERGLTQTRLIASLQNGLEIKGGITGNNNPMLRNGIPKIVRWFKGRASFELRKTDEEFCWQTRYYDRIIRNRDEYFAIIQYIKSNPEKWNDNL